MSLRRRLLSAILLIPLVLASVYFGGWFYFAIFSAALLLAGWEFFRLTANAGNATQPALGLGLIALWLMGAVTPALGAREIIIAMLALSLIRAIFQPRANWLTGWALTFAGALYVGAFGSYILALRALPNGLMWVTITLFATWATDSFAFLFGTLFGRTPFFQHISPKKTWEGAIGGWGGAISAGWLLGSLYGLDPFLMSGFGFGIGILATIGDLVESLIKRQVGAKDSGAIVPGHGGALDRLDSLLFTFPFAFYFVTVLFNR